MAIPYTYVDGGVSIAVAGRSSGGTSLTVTTGHGVRFGSPTTIAPLRLAVGRYGLHITTLKVTNITGDVLTIAGAMDGHADAAVLIGDDVVASATMGDFNELWTAIGSGGTGSTFRQGTGVPSNSLGIDGDIYVDTATGDLYQRATGVYATVLQGYTPTTWRSGTGVPSNSLGIDGDFYVDNATGNLYERATGTYTLITNIKGPTGATGATGPAGSGGSAPYEMSFVLAQGSDLAAGTNLTGNGRIATRAGTLDKVMLQAATNGAGGGFTLDVKKNGTSIFTTLPAVAASTTTVQTFTPTSTAFASGDVYTVDCTSVGGAGIRGILLIVAGLVAV